MKKKNAVISSLLTAVILILSVTITSNNSLIQPAVAQDNGPWPDLQASNLACLRIDVQLSELRRQKSLVDNGDYSQFDGRIRSANEKLSEIDRISNDLWGLMEAYDNTLASRVAARAATTNPQEQARLDAEIKQLQSDKQQISKTFDAFQLSKLRWLDYKWNVIRDKWEFYWVDKKIKFYTQMLESIHCRHHPSPAQGLDFYTVGSRTYTDGSVATVYYCAACKSTKDEYDARLKWGIDMSIYLNKLNFKHYLLNEIKEQIIAEKLSIWDDTRYTLYKAGYKNAMNNALDIGPSIDKQRRDNDLEMQRLAKSYEYLRICVAGSVSRCVSEGPSWDTDLNTLKSRLVKCIGEKCKHPCPIRPGSTPPPPGTPVPTGCEPQGQSAFSSTIQQQGEGAFEPPAENQQGQQGANFERPATDEEPRGGSSSSTTTTTTDEPRREEEQRTEQRPPTTPPEESQQPQSREETSSGT
jgi:hypothetical protein